MHACMQSILAFDNRQDWTIAQGLVCHITIITSWSGSWVTTQTLYNELNESNPTTHLNWTRIYLCDVWLGMDSRMDVKRRIF